MNLADKKGARYHHKTTQGEPCPQVSSTRISSKEKMHKLFLALALGSAAAVDVTADAAKLENGRRVLSTAHQRESRA